MDPIMKKPPLVIGIGELLWDLLPAGKQLGGAPANFAYHAQALGAEALVVSGIGNDALGREILHNFNRLGMRTDGITINPAVPTGTVGVELDARGKPTFSIHDHVAWDLLVINDDLACEAKQAEAICFGTLGQRHLIARSTIRSMLTLVPPTALRVFDINLRQHFWSKEIIAASLKLANVFKLNDEELPIVAQLFDLAGNEGSQLRQLAELFELRAVALTKAANGSLLLVGDKLASRDATDVVIVDTVGAGDSYTAALTMGLLARHEPEQILECAHRIAGYVCTQSGAMPPMPEALLADFGLVVQQEVGK
jgi:fructokinase